MTTKTAIQKILLPFIAPAMLAAVSCVRDSLPECEPIRFEASAPETKGYVTDTSLYDGGSPRTLMVSGHMYGQDGTEEDFCRNEPFVRTDGGVWEHDPVLYWPLGSRMDFLLWSSGEEVDHVEWNVVNVASEAKLHIGEGHLQDDILYSSIWGSEPGSAMKVRMYHSQAWIHLDTVYDSTRVTVESVALSDIYKGGQLIISNHYGEPEASWSFRTETAGDFEMKDAGDVLIPEQDRTSFSVRYLSDGVSVSRSVALPTAKWLMGRKYVYELEFKTDGLKLNVVTLDGWDSASLSPHLGE